MAPMQQSRRQSMVCAQLLCLHAQLSTSVMAHGLAQACNAEAADRWQRQHTWRVNADALAGARVQVPRRRLGHFFQQRRLLLCIPAVCLRRPEESAMLRLLRFAGKCHAVGKVPDTLRVGVAAGVARPPLKAPGRRPGQRSVPHPKPHLHGMGVGSHAKRGIN